jgi:ribosomal protein L7Ae-like RNA K-turn-binding protein
MGIARRAGKLLIGHDAVMLSVRNKKALAVILTSDASKRHIREIEAADFQGKVIVLDAGMDEAGYMTGKRSCIFALEDEGFIKAINKTLIEEGI